MCFQYQNTYISIGEKNPFQCPWYLKLLLVTRENGGEENPITWKSPQNNALYL